MRNIALAFCFAGVLTAPAVQANEVKSNAEGKQQTEVIADIDEKVAPVMDKLDAASIGTTFVVADSKSAVVAENNQKIAAAVIGETAAEPAGNEKQGAEFVKRFIAGRLQIGTRMTHRILTDDDSGHKGGLDGSGTFLGTIYALDIDQDYMPKYLFLRYAFSKYLSAEFAYDSVKAATVATTIGYSHDKSDGDVIVSGPTISLVATIANSSRFTPYGSLGIGFYSGDFDESAHWGLGYRDPSEYEAMGSPSTSNNGRIREIEVESKTGLTFGAGCTYDINDNWLLDLSVQYTSVDVDGTFYGYTDGVLDTEQDGHFPMNNIAFRFGVAYQF